MHLCTALFLRVLPIYSGGFLSAAQPSDQGEESVVVLLLVVVVGAHFISTEVQFFGV